MAARIPARLTRQQGRKFGFTVGGAFLLLAGIAWWRQSPTTMAVFATIGGALAFGALVAPTRLGPVERAWMGLAHAISRVTTPIVMGVMYFVVISPFAYLRRAFAGNPLVHTNGPSGFWKQRPDDGRRSKSMERQF